MRITHIKKKMLAVSLMAAFSQVAVAQAKPNIVFVMMDNLGYGEIGAYGGGIVRGAGTPNIDSIAEEGLKLTNFNVEPQCTPTRAAFMTGRHPIRSGAITVPTGATIYGLVGWEKTIPELLKEQGYATGMFGKWHLGNDKGRYPTDQGFDYWYGIANTTDEALYTETSTYPLEDAEKGIVTPPEYILESTANKKPEKIKLYNMAARKEIDNVLTDKAISFIQSSVKNDQPFFAYVPYTSPHYPVVASKKFEGKTGHGHWADVLAQIDWNVGKIQAELRKLHIDDNTIIVFTSDNGPDAKIGDRGWGGPWSGSYFTAKEGSLRTSFLVKWPHHIPAKHVSNEIVHMVDMLPTFASVTGANVPTDRPIDGIDVMPFFEGKRDDSGREGFPVYFASPGSDKADLYAIKWRNWKLHLIWQDSMMDEAKKLGMPKLYNLYDNPQEFWDEGGPTLLENTWALKPMFKLAKDFQASLDKYPPIKAGALDPYVPPVNDN
ncbi:sulfatase-like hydrolase/transferase [Aliivibrio salmonicida]|uniref:sulfatase-like hydrolase/transferase n=1 Tax=Aliivibrio salmonicida TaxID=40269 RepID=UPI003D13734B